MISVFARTEQLIGPNKVIKRVVNPYLSNRDSSDDYGTNVQI